MGQSAGKKKKAAVVLSGGGGNGAYEVGVLKALCSGQSPTTNYEPLDPDIFTGTSIGSFNSAFLVSQWDRYGSSAVSNLEKFWHDHLAGGWNNCGIFRIRGNPLGYLRPGLFANPMERLTDLLSDGGELAWEGFLRGANLASLSGELLAQRAVELVNLSSFVSTEPMMRRLRLIDYQAIRQSTKWLKIAATNWATGELRVFWNHDMTDRFGPVAIRASASIPGFFPPVEFGSQPFCDGSVLLNTPISPALHAGAEILHVVYLDPEVKNIPLAHIDNTYESLLRMMQITWANAFNDDIEDAGRINRLLALFDHIARSGAMADELEGLLEADPVLKRFAHAEEDRRLRQLTIYRYHPKDPLEGNLGFLNFHPERVEALVERGFQDTVNHDWEESADIFPVGAARPAKPHEQVQR